ncbi:hypothetical protein UlMin_033931 [Ulmus minor]
MEDGVLSPATMLGAPSDSAMDLDFMDELFLEGCWLETREGSEFLNDQSFPTSSNSLFDSFLGWPNLDSNGLSSSIPSQNRNQEERQRPLSDEAQERDPFLPQSLPITDLVGPEAQTIEGSELSRRWWIGPNVNSGPSSSVVARLCMALGHIKDVIRDKDVLVQIWVPVHRGGKRVLTTNDLPFAVDPSSQKLAGYRDISVNFQFSAEKDCKELMGLPGRVFSGQVPEWTPDVNCFRSEEYPRLKHAQQCDVRGTIALPIFEQGSRNCLGVVEVVMTSPMLKYRPELESVCKALEAVNLESSEVLSAQNVNADNKYYRAALPEIQEVLRSACETHRLPLAQTWVPCIYQGKEGFRHSDENYNLCVSTVDEACYVADLHVQGFHEACSEHHLLKGQGLVGRAFMTNQPCFSDNITKFSNTDYPLSHPARMFGLHAAVAIRLRSIHTGSADFVLEFFLPRDCTDPEEQKNMLTSLSLIVQQCCQSLRVVSDEELEVESAFPSVTVSKVILPSGITQSGTACLTEIQESGSDVSLFTKEKPRETSNERVSKLSQNRDDSNTKQMVDRVEECSTMGEGSFSSMGVAKKGEKRRTKSEKTITLQVLQQYFSGSLKDAAKSIGVCSTTLKRICRQHGIKRWPSRKIKKVGHSLQKLQLVIDSVQGTSGAFQIDSFYTNFPKLASPNVAGISPFSTLNPSDNLKLSNVQSGDGISQAAPSKSSSSCSPSSSSSHCCSSQLQQQPSTWNTTGLEDLMARENSGDVVLKRVRSETMLNASTEDETKVLPRSSSHKCLTEHHETKNIPPVVKTNTRFSQEADFQRVKVTYGDDHTRFRIQKSCGFKDLQLEIGRRFKVEDMEQFSIKYLDDDSEWVLLTCDADLEECIEVYRFSQCNKIKLSLQLSRFHTNTFGANVPL